MSYRLTKIVPLTGNTGGTVTITAHVMCDSQSDLPAASAVTGYLMALGTTAECADDGTKWMMDSAGTWHQQPAGITLDLTGYYTSSQVDTIVAGLQPLLTFDAAPTVSSTNPVTSGGVFAALWGLQDISSGTDLDTLTTIGTYRTNSATVTNSLSNCPVTGAAIRLVVQRTSHTNRYYQLIIPADPADPTIYIRKYLSGWGSWYKWVGVAV